MVTLLIPVALSGCLNSFEPPPRVVVTIEGKVTRDGEPLPSGGVQVHAVGPSRTPLGSTMTDESGNYSLELTATSTACFSRIVAYLPASPFALESEPEFIPDYRSVRCRDVVPGPEVELPVTTAEYDTATVVGTITQAGAPASAQVWLMAVSLVDGLLPIATTTTDSLGGYTVTGPVPAPYCHTLVLETRPEAPVGLSVSGCAASLLDIDLGS